MTRELVIKNKHRIGTHGSQHFDFLDDSGKPIPLGKLFGRTTTWPTWYYGVTREIDGHTWWLVQDVSMKTRGISQYDLSHYDRESNYLGIVHCFPYQSIDSFSTVEQRAMIQMTEDEAKTMKVRHYPHRKYALGIREDAPAWDIFYGNKENKSIPVTITIKALDDKIESYIKKQGTNISPTQPSKSGIKKLNNYTPVKVLNKINEIIEYLNTRRSNIDTWLRKK